MEYLVYSIANVLDMDFYDYYEQLDLYKIKRSKFFLLTWKFLDPFGEHGGLSFLGKYYK